MATEVIGTSPEPALTVLRPVRKRVRLSDLWTSRGVARMIGLRDIKAKYKQAVLGPLWLLLAPAGMLLAVTIAFSGVVNVHTGKVPYVVFALVGLVVWTYLQLSISIASNSIIGNASLVRRSTVPRVGLVVGSMLGNLPAWIVMLTASVILAAAFGLLHVQALLLPFLIVWLFVLTGGIAMLLASVAVRFRDIVALIPLVIQAGLFVTPVGYPIEGAPDNIKTLLTINPASGLIEAWRWALLDMPVDGGVVIASGVWTVVLAFAGWQIFSRLEVHFSDVV
jgi:ABC-type polysaccharide/polyol phosphate export permease